MSSQLLIVAALQDEVRELKEKLAVDCTIHFKPAVFRRGLLFGKEVGLLTTGVGAEKSQKSLHQVLNDCKPEALLFLGYAGGCSPLAPVGSLILGEKILDAESGETFLADPELLKTAREACKKGGVEHRVGNLVTVNRVISGAHAKADLGAVHGCVALDMEGAAVARVACQRLIPFLVAKAILDPVEMELPDLQKCVDSEGHARPMMLMEHFAKKPADAMKLPQLQFCASQARESISRFVESYLKSL